MAKKVPWLRKRVLSRVAVWTSLPPQLQPPHLLGRLVFTLTRMTSQPSLLNRGRPVSSSCRIRLVAVMFKTTVISMLLPMKLEERVGRHRGHICHRGHYPYLLSACILCSSGRGRAWGTTYPGQKKGWDLPNITKPVFPLPSCFGKLLHILQNPAHNLQRAFSDSFILPMLPLSWANHSIRDGLCSGLVLIRGRNQVCIIVNHSVQVVSSRYSINGHVSLRRGHLPASPAMLTSCL